MDPTTTTIMIIIKMMMGPIMIIFATTIRKEATVQMIHRHDTETVDDIIRTNLDVLVVQIVGVIILITDDATRMIVTTDGETDGVGTMTMIATIDITATIIRDDATKKIVGMMRMMMIETIMTAGTTHGGAAVGVLLRAGVGIAPNRLRLLPRRAVCRHPEEVTMDGGDHLEGLTSNWLA